MKYRTRRLFRRISIVTFDRTAIKFGMVTHVGRGVFYRIRHATAYCTNASRGLSAIAELLVCAVLLARTPVNTCVDNAGWGVTYGVCVPSDAVLLRRASDRCQRALCPAQARSTAQHHQLSAATLGSTPASHRGNKQLAAAAPAPAE